MSAAALQQVLGGLDGARAATAGAAEEFGLSADEGARLTEHYAAASLAFPVEFSEFVAGLRKPGGQGCF